MCRCDELDLSAGPGLGADVVTRAGRAGRRGRWAAGSAPDGVWRALVWRALVWRALVWRALVWRARVAEVPDRTAPGRHDRVVRPLADGARDGGREHVCHRHV